MTTKEIFEKAAKDAALADKMAKAKTPEEAYEAAKAAGLTDSFDAFKATAKEINDANSKMSPEEVDAVAAAGDTTTTTTTTAAVPAAASAIVV